VDCQALADMVRKHGYDVLSVREDGGSCVIDFLHPGVRLMRPVPYFASSLHYDKRRGTVEVTVRAKVPRYKELYLDYCCEDGEMVCRPHVWMEENMVSVEAKFRKDPVERLRMLLSEML